MTTHDLDIPGYTYGAANPTSSPVGPAELDALLTSAAFTPEDREALALAGEVLADQVEQVLDVWYGFVGSHPHLVAYFSTPEGVPLPDYLARVRARFGQWIIDSCTRAYDQDWLDYQQEIALRHTEARKNLTDDAPSVPLVPLRHVIAFISPITLTVRPFLAARGHSPEQVDAMHQAWLKSVVLQVALWSQPYAGDRW